MNKIIFITLMILSLVVMFFSQIIGYHWCIQETLMLMTSLPFIGGAISKLHALYIKHFDKNHNCHDHTERHYCEKDRK